MNVIRAVLLTILLILLPPALAAGETCKRAGLDEARTLALRAAALLAERGPVVSFDHFVDPDGEFIDRDLYVFVLDYTGRIWFNARFAIRPGQNILDAQDRHGRFYVREMIRIAREAGEGWVEYEWINPCTGAIEPKSAYVVNVGPLIVAVGAYGRISL